MSPYSPNQGLLSHSASGIRVLKNSNGRGYNERRMSFGIGGAGNIRTVTEATIHDFYAVQDGQQRRQSSAAASSASSSPSRRTKFIDSMRSLFGSSSPKDVEKRSYMSNKEEEG